MADFEQFIYFILRCACFSRSFLLFHRLHRLATLPLDSLCVWVMAEEAKKEIQQQFHDSLAISSQ
jgi:hypothetical protein